MVQEVPEYFFSGKYSRKWLVHVGTLLCTRQNECMQTNIWFRLIGLGLGLVLFVLYTVALNDFLENSVGAVTETNGLADTRSLCTQIGLHVETRFPILGSDTMLQRRAVR